MPGERSSCSKTSCDGDKAGIVLLFEKELFRLTLFKLKGVPMRHLFWRVQSPERQPALREGVKRPRPPRGETKRAFASRIGFVILGLLCHLLLFLLLFFPYVRVSDPYRDSVLVITGWNLGDIFLDRILVNLVSGVLPALVLLPILSYLACLLLLFLKRERANAWLAKSLYLNVLWNTLGLLMISGFLFISGMQPTREWDAVRDASYAIPLALFLFSAVCSSVGSILLGLLLRRIRRNER
jgi:hypothetical protein